MRVSIGRHGEPTTLQYSDRVLIDRTFGEALTIPGWETATLVDGAVNRWGGALPQYQVGHRDLVAQLRSRWPADLGWRWQVRRWTEWESRPAWVPRRPRSTPSRLTSDSAVMT